MTVQSGVAGTKKLKAMPAKQERIVRVRSQRISFKRYAAIVRIEARCPARCPIKTSCSISKPPDQPLSLPNYSSSPQRRAPMLPLGKLFSKDVARKYSGPGNRFKRLPYLFGVLDTWLKPD